MNSELSNLEQTLASAIANAERDLGKIETGISISLIAPDGSSQVTSGISNQEFATPTSQEDLFNIASISKSYTAAVVLKLVEQDKLSLDDTLDRWLPEIAEQITNGENLTLRQLLNGTGGLWDYLNGDDGFFADLLADYESGNIRDWQPQDLIAYAFERPLFSGEDSTPTWTYTNTGNILAALIVEQATGKEFAEVLSAEILEPWGLDRTFFTTEDVSLEQRARGYDDLFTLEGELGSDGLLEDYSFLNSEIAFGAGSMVASADDVARFFHSLAAGNLLQPESTAEIFNYINVIPNSSEARFGLGVLPNQYAGAETRSMSGSIFGYESEVDYFIDRETTISLLSNDSSRRSRIVKATYKASVINSFDLNRNSTMDNHGTVNDDAINSGDDNDLVQGSAEDDYLFGQGGDDTLNGSLDDDFLNGGLGDDLLIGGRGQDLLVGGTGDDLLTGSSGDDDLAGGSGQDILSDLEGDNALFGNDGDDLLVTGSGDDLLYGDGGNDRLFAKAGENRLFGGLGNDYLTGGVNDDELFGGEGDDTLLGSGGVNYLTGGAGNDLFILTLDGTSAIADFNLTADSLQLDEAISAEDLAIVRGQDEHINNTLIIYGSEEIAVLIDIDRSTVTAASFI